MTLLVDGHHFRAVRILEVASDALLTNERRVLIVLTNEKPALPDPPSMSMAAVMMAVFGQMAFTAIPVSLEDVGTQNVAVKKAVLKMINFSRK